MPRPFWLQPTVERSCFTIHEGVSLTTIETPTGECYYRVSEAGQAREQNGNPTREVAKRQAEKAATERDEKQQ